MDVGSLANRHLFGVRPTPVAVLRGVTLGHPRMLALSALRCLSTSLAVLRHDGPALKKTRLTWIPLIKALSRLACVGADVLSGSKPKVKK